MDKNYQKLEKRFAELTAINEVLVLLDWDRSVLMPVDGVNQRARQASVLGVLHHNKISDPAIADEIAAVDRKQLDEWQLANLALMARQHRNATALNADLVERRMTQETRTELIWREARAQNDFAMVAGPLENLISIVREAAAAKADVTGLSPYDALMKDFSPSMLTADVDPLFDDLAVFLKPFIGEVIAAQEMPLPLAPVDIRRQEEFGRKLAGFLGFDPAWSRLDVSTHPFSMGVGDDVRITTRYNADDFMIAAQGIAHEAGHGFYDRFTPRAWQHQPVGISGNMGMAVHESQSLSLDMQLGRSQAYWRFLAPHLQADFGVSGAAWSAENLFRQATRVERSFIRVDADEVTYPAHIILRYRLEKDLIAGKLRVKDLPDAWNAAMQDLIGAVPPDNRRGCLQDIHWYCGSFGYFPAYALGAIMAAQFAAKMKRDIPDLDARLEKGDFAAFVGWLRDNVHAKGCLYQPRELVRRVTGEDFTVHYFKQHLSQRYLGGRAWPSATSAHAEKRSA